MEGTHELTHVEYDKANEHPNCLSYEQYLDVIMKVAIRKFGGSSPPSCCLEMVCERFLNPYTATLDYGSSGSFGPKETETVTIDAKAEAVMKVVKTYKGRINKIFQKLKVKVVAPTSGSPLTGATTDIISPKVYRYTVRV